MRFSVLDTSGILCLLFNEAGTDRLLEILNEARERPDCSVLAPFMALMEVEYWLRRRLTPDEVARTLLLLENWPVQIRDFPASSGPGWRLSRRVALPGGDAERRLSSM